MDLATAETRCRGMGLRGRALQVAARRCCGRTYTEIAAELELIRPQVLRYLREAKRVMARKGNLLDAEIWDGEQARIREIRGMLRIMQREIFESGILAHWRRPTLGARSVSGAWPERGRRLRRDVPHLPRVAVVVAEDIIDEPAPVV